MKVRIRIRMKVRIRIRIWIHIQDSFEGSYDLFYKVSSCFGATFQIAFEKYTLLNRLDSYAGSIRIWIRIKARIRIRIWIRIQASYEGSCPDSYLDPYFSDIL